MLFGTSVIRLPEGREELHEVGLSERGAQVELVRDLDGAGDTPQKRKRKRKTSSVEGCVDALTQKTGTVVSQKGSAQVSF